MFDTAKSIVRGFAFDRVTINEDLVCKEHVDTNASWTLICLLGSLVGGALCLKGGHRMSNTRRVRLLGRRAALGGPFLGKRYSIVVYLKSFGSANSLLMSVLHDSPMNVTTLPVEGEGIPEELPTTVVSDRR